PLRGGATAAQRSLGKGVGIHYTDTATIMKIVEPVVLRPLAAEWETVKAAIDKAKGVRKKDDLYLGFRERLAAFRVLDPACGSGAFLYMALRHLKDFDRKVEEEAKALGVTADPKGQRITPQTVLGIEINPYAAELARVTVWIGELQWQMANGYGVTRRPILGALEGIENRDALLNADGTVAHWPNATVIIGNPPFLGGKKLLGALGDEYVRNLRATYEGLVPNFADLVCYWIEKSRHHIELGSSHRAGLVATNSVRGGASRIVLDQVRSSTRMFSAWSDEPWALDGAAVRVSIVCFGENSEATTLNGEVVDSINSDLTASDYDLTKAASLSENSDACYEGGQKYGDFDIDGSLARRWLAAPINPNGRSNRDVLRPYFNAIDVVRRPNDRWIVDFGSAGTEEEAALYEEPFSHVLKRVKPGRAAMKRETHRRYWWRHGWVRLSFDAKRLNLKRYIATPVVAKHRVFCWLHHSAFPSNLLDVVARDDDATFGILQSKFHELWALRLGTSLEDRPRYTPSTTFETFAFPAGLTPRDPASDHNSDLRASRIGEAAAKLNELRENWLNPSDLVKRVPEVVPGYPDRLLPKDLASAEQLKKRTLTNLYNERPTWLAHAHRDLDRAVAAAYGWPEVLADRAQPENPDAADRKAAEEEILKRLFDLNQERAKAGR
ncbi:MAG: class I SAM-dependent DNA methyltransferase, partial [Rhodospirillales bacterium]|nr:class I SAM-dependent DNA methyltransferase [Rhodospirillales bacterium]